MSHKKDAMLILVNPIVMSSENMVFQKFIISDHKKDDQFDRHFIGISDIVENSCTSRTTFPTCTSVRISCPKF